MNYTKLLYTAAITGLGCFISLATSQVTVLAQSFFPEPAQYLAQRESQSSAVMMVQLPQVEVNLESSSNSEIMGQLAVPLQLGGQTVPAGSYVRLAVIPQDNDAYLIADMIIIPSNGATISVSAAGSTIPGTTITDRRSEDIGKEASAIGTYLGERAGLALGGDADDAIQSGSGGGLIGAVAGLASSSKRQVVQLVQGVYFLEIN